jgi:Tfp pilus assembly protein PilF
LSSLAFVSLVSFVVLTSGCRGGPAASDQRERAYGANNRGIALLERFEYAEAAAAFREALAIDSSLGIAHLNLSLALLYGQDLPAAEREAAEAARLMPGAPQPPYVRGLIARAENRPDDALRELERVRAIDADDPGTNINLGQLFLEQRRYGEAITALRRARSFEPYNVTAVYNLGLALTRAGEEPEGRDALSRAQALRSVGYAVTYGNGYLEQGRYAEAVVSTGAEPDLVDAAPSRAMFTATVVAPLPGAGGGVALLDADEDGDLDIYAASPAGDRMFRNEANGRWSDISATALGAVSGEALGAVAGDYDNDGRTDLFVLRTSGSTLLRNEGNGRFANATTRAGLRIPNPPSTAAWADLDHDGDIDLVAGSPSSALQVMRNNGDGSFVDTTRDTGLQNTGAAVQPIAIAPTDYDNRRDLDLLVLNQTGLPMLFRNERDGTFDNVAGAPDSGLSESALAGRSSVAVGDINKDGFADFVFFGGNGETVLALSDGRDRFRTSAAPEAMRGLTTGQLFDYDNDGLLDLLAWSASGGRVIRNLGERWADVTSAAMPSALSVAPENPRGIAVGDLDGNGTSDLVVLTTAGLSALMNRGDPDRRSLRVQLKGRVGNRSGLGAKVQIRAGSLNARVETAAATPMIAPADIVFGLGTRSSADAVRVLWPSGILQAETLPAAAAASPVPPPLVIEELDRKPSSCPFLFTWNGERFEFVTDFLGAGEMGYWEAPGVRNVPDPIEYVRIRGDQLRAREGRFELRITNELEETLFLDRVQLLALDHPADVEVHPNEGMTSPPKPFGLFAVADPWTPSAADDASRDVTARIKAVDRTYPDGLPLEPIRGYAKHHALTLDLAAGLAQGRAADVLLLTAWTDYAFSSDNVAASQAGLIHLAPALDVRDVHGRWRRVVEQIGLPVGRPQTVPVQLAGRLRPGEHVIRIVTTMRVFWDRIAIGRAAPVGPLSKIALDPAAAVLRSRGFSAELRPNGTDPLIYDYSRVTPHSLWKVMTGHYTRTGDVKELMVRSDDMFVIAAPGDEVALAFEAAALPPTREGWTRTFLLFADGYSKEMDINSSTPDHVEPLPFHGMSGYPYPSTERYPDTPEHRRYQETFNTRVLRKSLPTIGTP